VNPTLALLNGTSADAFVLLALRIGGLVLTAPVFSSRTLPVMLRTGLIVLLSCLLAPLAVPAGTRAVLTPATALTETLVGLALGLGAAIFVAAAELAGDMVSISTGLSGAAAMDPITNQSIPVLGQFMNLFVVTALFSIDAHHVMIGAVAESARAIPVGAPLDVEAGLARTVQLGSVLFLLGLRFAAPVVAVVLIGNIALAILSRAAPQLNVLAVAFPLQIGLGLFALATAIPMIGAFLAGWSGMYGSVVEGVLGAFAGPGGR
jgi:flagellar biosynthetic protein FliR